MSNAPHRVLLVGALLSVVLTACSSLGIGAPGPGTLDGRTFLSTKVTQNGADKPLVAGSRLRLQFAKDGNLGINAGCNHITGTWSVVNGTLSFTGGAMTEMACAEPLMTQDTWIADLLSKNPAVTLTGNDLILTAGDTTISLLDREVAEPDLPLVGPTWTLTSIVTGDSVSSVNGTASLVFGADGRVTVNTGCNTGGGTYTLEGQTLTFGAIATTKRACLDETGGTEAPMLDLLRAGKVTWSIDASQLSLRSGAGGGLDFLGA